MHDMSLFFKCGWKMSHRTLLTLIMQIYLLFNKVHSLDSQPKKKSTYNVKNMFGTKFLVTYFKKWKNTIERLVWACVFKKNLCFICCQYHLGLIIFKIITIMLLKTVIQKLKTTSNEFSKYNVQSLYILNWELWLKHSYQTYISFWSS